MKHATGGTKEGEGPRADDPLQDNQIVESMVGMDDVRLTREAWQYEMRVFEERKVYQHVLRPPTQESSQRALITRRRQRMV